MTFEDLESEALNLAKEKRAELLHVLMLSLDEDETQPAHERLSNEEIKRRCRAIDEGRARLIPSDEVFAGVEAALGTPDMTFGELLSLALKLSPDDREELVRSLIFSLDEGVDTASEEEIQKFWVAEAKRRYQDYLEGREVAIPGEEALRSLRATLNGRAE